MFDPYHIGSVNTEDVEVVEVLSGFDGRFQSFRGVLKLQGHRHHLWFHPNWGGKRDPIVIDRLKYLFDVEPNHTFGVVLPFVFKGGELVSDHGCEYLAVSVRPGEWNSLRALRSNGGVDIPVAQEEEFQVELCKIVLFRFVSGLATTSDEDILVRTDGAQVTLLSLHEVALNSYSLGRNFAKSLRFLPASAWERAREEFIRRYDLDHLRGILLQTRKPERELKRRRPKGPLHLPVQRLAEIIEERVERITNCPLEEILNQME
jgi:hypothetical protein